MSDFIKVKPDTSPAAVPVKTKVVDGEHIPVYIPLSSDGEEIDAGNPAEVKLPDLTHETDIVTLLNEISGKLSILIKYEAMLHKVDLEEDL